MAVFAAALTAFEVGVGVSDREGVPTAALATQIYYALGLFVFGGLDLGMPTGGPVWARVLLWVAYFAAPAITTSALIEGALILLQPEAWRLRRARDHVVIAGCGRLAMLYLQRLRAVDKKRPVVLVERVPDHPNARIARQRYRSMVLAGDIANEDLLASLRLPQARRVALLTGDDYANLGAAAAVGRLAPGLTTKTLVHVADIRLLRILEQKGVLPEAVKFNSYRRAARHLVQERLLPHFVSTGAQDSVVLGGFGRFGQTVLAELQCAAAGRFGRVVICDRVAEQRTEVFREQVGFSDDYVCAVVEGDVRHPSTWEKIHERLPGHEPVVLVIGTGDESANLRTALGFAGAAGTARVYVRVFERTSFIEQLADECGFEVVSTADLLIESLAGDGVVARPR